MLSIQSSPVSALILAYVNFACHGTLCSVYCAFHVETVSDPIVWQRKEVTVRKKKATAQGRIVRFIYV